MQVILESEHLATMSIDERNRDLLWELLATLTHSGRDLDEVLLSKAESLLTESKVSAICAFEMLEGLLTIEHAEVRIAALLIMDRFVRVDTPFREKFFRSLPCITQYLVFTKREKPTLEPIAAARELQDLSLRKMYEWNEEFGHSSVLVSRAYRHFKIILKKDFDKVIRECVIRDEIEAERKRIYEKKLEDEVLKIHEDLVFYMSDIMETQNSLNTCLQILIPHIEDFFVPDAEYVEVPSSAIIESAHEKGIESSKSADCLEPQEIDAIPCTSASSSLREHGIMNHEHEVAITLRPYEHFKIQITDDNLHVIETIKDNYNLVVKRYLPLLKNCKKKFEKRDNFGNLDLVCSLLNSLESDIQKLKELNVFKDLVASQKVPAEDDSSSDSDLEDVESKCGYEAEIGDALLMSQIRERMQNKPKASATVTSATVTSETAYQENTTTVRARCDSPQPGPSRMPDYRPLRVEDWVRMDLVGQCIIKRERPDTNNVWAKTSVSQCDEASGPVVHSIPVEVPTKFEPVLWTCRALMPNGKLCTRRDRIKCPFHGRIVARDRNGCCANPKDAKAEQERQERHARLFPDWQDPKLMEDLEKKHGIDLRMPKKGQKIKNTSISGHTETKTKGNLTSRQRLANLIFKGKRSYPDAPSTSRKRRYSSSSSSCSSDDSSD